MASPSINWDDFENQALLVQELLSDPVEITDCHFSSETGVTKDSPQPEKGWLEESPLLITQVAKPPALVMLSPESQQHSMSRHRVVTLTPVKRREDSNSHHQESEVKTPLRDCTNINQKILSDTVVMVTPENIKNIEKPQSTICPSSAEFKKFLDDIMAASPVLNVFEDAEETTENECQLPVTSEAPESLPVVKVHARRGTYDLDEPSCDLSILSDCESASALVQLIKPTPDLLIELSTDTHRKADIGAADNLDTNNTELPHEIHSLHINEKNEVDGSGQTLHRQINNTPLQKDNSEIGKHNSELKNCGGNRQNEFSELQTDNNEDHKDNSESQKEINDGLKVNNVIQNVEAYRGSNAYQTTTLVHIDNEAQKDIFEVQKDNDKSHKSVIEGSKEKTEAHKATTVNDIGPHVLKPNKRLLCKNSNLRRPLSRFSSADVGVCGKSQAPVRDTDHSPCLPRQPACDIADGSVASDYKTEENKREENVHDACEKTFDSIHREQNDKHATSHVSYSDDSSAEKQEILDALLKKRISPEKPEIPNALPENDISPESQDIPNILPENDSSPEKLDIPNALPENESCPEKQGISDAPLKSPSTTAASVSDLPVKTTEKAQVCPSTVVLKKVPVSKLPLMRPGQMQSKLRRPSSGIASLQSQRPSTASLPGEGIKIKSALPLKPVIKPQTDSCDLGQKKTQESSRLLPKLHLRPPSKASERSLVAPKVPLGQPKLEAKGYDHEVIRPSQPQKKHSAVGMEGAQSLATNLACRPSVKKGPVKAAQQMDGSKTVTKRTSPMKALFPLDGSRTVTKDVHSEMSRTVTKAVQPAGYRTVSKTSDVPMSETPNNRPIMAGTTDKFIAPRRLSNIFNKSSSLGYSSRHSQSVNSSQQRPDSSGFEAMITIDESGAFKPKSALVLNTPDVRPRRLSMWSPVQRNKILGKDLAYQCTKRGNGTQDS